MSDLNLGESKTGIKDSPEKDLKTNENHDASKANQKAKHTRIKKSLKKYIFSTLIGLVVFISALFISASVFIVMNGRKNVANNEQAEALHPRDIKVETDVMAATGEVPIVPIPTEEPVKAGIIPTIIQAPRKTNALVLGCDQSGFLSDVMVFITFDSKTKKIDVISLPRDTYITITQEQVEELRRGGSHFVPSSGVMKLNELHSYAGKKNGMKYSKAEVEELLGVKIDYTAEVDLKAFRKIIDLVGGIEVDVPGNGMYYRDPEQNLSISIPAGRQLLDGNDAEGFMRFRHGYDRGDLDRIDNQKRFMKEFFSQVVQKEVIANNIMSLINIFLENVKTDFGITDIPQYLTSLNGISADKVSFYTLPGEMVKLTGWYYKQDVAASNRLIANTALLYDEESAPVTSATTIRFYNGSYSTTTSMDMITRLRDAGFAVTDVGDYVGTKKAYTRIYARDEETALRISKMFTNTRIDTESVELLDGCDALVVVGIDEAGE